MHLSSKYSQVNDRNIRNTNVTVFITFLPELVMILALHAISTRF